MTGNTCSKLSVKSGEQLFGTSPTVRYWFLLEYNFGWGENILKSGILSENIKLKLSDLLKTNNFSRLQWIKNAKSTADKIMFFVVKSTVSEKKIYKKTLDSYEDILSLDPAQISSDWDISEVPLLLVCTHRTYDDCCGELGYSLYDSIYKEEKDFEIWQTTHLGGHRFAANVLLLPEGIYYGRIDKVNYKLLKTDYKKNQITIGNLRGRACYNREEQAAEYYLRNTTGIMDINSLEVVSSDKSGEFIACTKFLNKPRGVLYNVYIKELPHALQICAGCSDKNLKSVSQFELLDIVESVS